MERVRRARTLLGVPYLHLGRSVQGLDCVGLLVYADAVPIHEVPANYPPNPLNSELENNLTRYYGEPVVDGVVTLADLQVGDIVAMQYRGPIRHVGIVGDYQFQDHQFSLIHTDSTHGRVVEHALDTKWLRRIRRVYRT